MLIGVALATPVSAQTERLALEDFPRSELILVNRDGKRHTVPVYLAVTPRQIIQGLMFVTELPEDTGMLFRFEPPRQAAMWMRNTLISLDMVFIRSDGTVANVIANAVPGDLSPLRSEGIVAGVLELNAGTAARLRVDAGAIVEHPFFRTAGAG